VRARRLLPAGLASAAVIVLAACTGGGPATPAPSGSVSSGSAAAEAGRPDIVLILTDDQRYDTLDVMPTVGHELVAKGVTFTNAVVVNPVCCPSRASILTGQYSHTNGIYTNSAVFGGVDSFDADSTIATSLHDNGYRTALIGKYLNGYDVADPPPPGWDRWFAYSGDGGAYLDYRVRDQDHAVTYGDEEADYSTDVFAEKADEFIRSTDPSTPLFLYFAPRAPHEPATPPLRYADAFAGVSAFRPPSYDEPDVSDKPAYVRGTKLEETATDLRIDQYRSLLAVDDAVDTILAALEETGRLKNTLIVLTSDNGFLWGEHRLMSKNAPYEESIRVPFVVRYDSLPARSRRDGHLIANIDLAPTFADLAGISLDGVEGASLLPLLRSPDVQWRGDVLIEHLQSRNDIPTFCAVRSTRYVYVAYQTGEEELYDLRSDPYELENRIDDPAMATTRTALKTRLGELCDPPPPGFTLP
jgi:N-acetylglucosamine-6-sulfatase